MKEVIANAMYHHSAECLHGDVVVNHLLRIEGSGGAIYLSYLVLNHNDWSTQEGMPPFRD